MFSNHKKKETYPNDIIQVPKGGNINVNCHAEKCPVCGGTGTYVQKYQPAHSTTTITLQRSTCHGCGGKGWVTVYESTVINCR